MKILFNIFFDYIYIYFFLKSNKNISNSSLYIRLDGIGDSMIWIDSLLTIEDPSFNNRNKILVTRDEYKDLFNKLNIFDKIVSINYNKFCKSIKYRIFLYKNLNSLNIFEAINPIYSNHIFTYYDSIIFSTKAKNRIIGPVFKSNNVFATWIRNFKSNVYTAQIKFKYNNNEHQFLYDYNFLQKSNIKTNLFNTSLDKNLFHSEKFLYLNKNYVVIAPGSSNQIKNWSIENYSKLIKFLISQNIQIVCIGSKSETNICLKFERQFNIINLCDQTNIMEMCMLISNSRLVISNDTSSIHIAATFKIPSICIMWGASYGRFLPYPDIISNIFLKPIIINNLQFCINCKNSCSKISDENTALCLKNISSDTVIKYVKNEINIEKHN
jgi:ADP-heptose:LPS heptosyltransferase